MKKGLHLSIHDSFLALLLLSGFVSSCTPGKLSYQNLQSSDNRSGSSTPSLAWSPLIQSFGSSNVGSPTTSQTFTLSNTGTGSATGCSAPIVSGANSTDFSITADNC